MKFQLSRRPVCTVFDLDPGQAFLHNGEIYLAIPMCTLAGGKMINAVKLTSGSIFCFDAGMQVELITGTFIEDDISADPAEGL